METKPLSRLLFKIGSVVILTLIGCIAFSSNTYASTDIRGRISENTIWDEAGSPYIIKESIWVDPEIELTIKPGVQVLFDNSTRINVRGKIIAVGSPNARILFNSTDGQLSNYSIYVYGSNSLFDYCEMQNSADGRGALNFYDNSANNTVRNSKIHNNDMYGIFSTGQNIIESCDIYNNGAGITVYSRNTITKCNIFNNTIGIRTEVISSPTIISECNIYGNTTGVSLRFPSDFSITSCNIMENYWNVEVGDFTTAGSTYNLSNNYWGSTNTTEIQSKIHDFNTDPSRAVSVIEPYLMEPVGAGMVTADYASYTYNSPITVTLSAIGEEYEIRYTLDDSDPTIYGSTYTSPILIDHSLNLKVTSVKDGVYGPVITYSYGIEILGTVQGHVSGMVNPYHLEVSLGDNKTYTDAQGFFQFVNIPLGTYNLSATFPSFTCDPIEIVLVDSNTINQDLVLIPVNIPITSIIVSSPSSTIETPGGTLQMTAEVQPATASNKTVSWSVENGTGRASISNSGLLTALSNGVVTVKATANDGSGIVGSKEITVINQPAIIPFVIDVAFKIGSNSSPSVLVPDKLLEAIATVTNNQNFDQSALVIVALYDPSGSMVNISYVSRSIAANISEMLYCGFKLPSDISGYQARAFVWDGTDLGSTTMTPLSNVVSIPY